jgi:hypothetical protein
MNYATNDLELAVIVNALKMWKHHLMGITFELRTNRYGLKPLFRHPKLNSRQTRWLEFLSEYDFEIKHIKEKENQVVDAISNRDHEICISSISMFHTYLKKIILEAANSYQQYLKINETI